MWNAVCCCVATIKRTKAFEENQSPKAFMVYKLLLLIISRRTAATILDAALLCMRTSYAVFSALFCLI